MKCSKSRLTVYVALVYTLLFSYSTLALDFALLQSVGGDAWQKMLIELVLSFSYVWVLFFVVPRFLWLFLFLIGGLVSYSAYTFGVQINERIIAVVFETNISEALGFVSVSLIIWMTLTLVASFVLMVFVSRYQKEDPDDMKLLLVASVFLFCALFLDGGTSSRYVPYNVIKGAGGYLLKHNGFADERMDISSGAISRDNEPLVVVMVIGESARASNFSLNGYHRNTNPFLLERRGLINYPDVTACDTLTRYSVPCIMTRADHKNRQPIASETSFISVFKKLGFHTVWFDMQGVTASVFDSPIRDIALESDVLVSLNTDAVLDVVKDEQVLALMARHLSKDKVLIVLHSFGSHWPFDSRYSNEYRKWSPVCGKTTPFIGGVFLTRDMSECEIDALINEYDNSILYTDYVLDSMIEQLKNKNALLLYTSDHGESLGENGLYLHGHEGVKEEIQVPMLWWASDLFKRAHPDRIKSLKNTKKVSHENVFHSILDCTGVQSQVVNLDLSLCR